MSHFTRVHGLCKKIWVEASLYCIPTSRGCVYLHDFCVSKMYIQETSKIMYRERASAKGDPESSLGARRLARGEVGVDAGVRGAGRDLLGLLVVVVGTLVLDADVLDRGGAGVGDGGNIAVVGVDADKGLAAVGLDVGEGDLAGIAVLLAVCGDEMSATCGRNKREGRRGVTYCRKSGRACRSRRR